MVVRPLVILVGLFLVGAVAGVLLFAAHKKGVGPDVTAMPGATGLPVVIGVHDGAPASGKTPTHEPDSPEATQLRNMAREERLTTTSCTPPVKPVSGDDEPADFTGIALGLVQLRQLGSLPPMTIRVERGDVERRIGDWLRAHYPPNYGVRLGEALQALGAIPEKVDTLNLKAALLSYEIGAWFDSADENLYLVERDKPDEKENALGLAYGDLFRTYGPALFNKAYGSASTDGHLARESLLAGDAALTRLLHSLKDPQRGGGGGVGEDPDDPSRAVPIPNFLRELTLAPFSQGLPFARSLHSLGEFDQVDASYQRPPVTCAEVRDTQEFLAESPPELPAIDWPDVTLLTHAPVFDDHMGVFCLELYVKQYLAEARVRPLLGGWANDRLVTYTAPGKDRDHAAWQTLWKTPAAASAFFDALRESLANRYKRSQPKVKEDDGGYRLETTDRVVILRKNERGLGVLLVDAADAAFADAAVARLGKAP